jgi:long-chain acyl-CoA synthetase
VRTAVAAIARKRRRRRSPRKTRLRADLGFDSLMAMELAVALEAHPGRQVAAGAGHPGDRGRAGAGAGAVRASRPGATKPARKAPKDDDDEPLRLDAAGGPCGRGEVGAIAVLQREFYGSVMKPG